MGSEWFVGMLDVRSVIELRKEPFKHNKYLFYRMGFFHQRQKIGFGTVQICVLTCLDDFQLSGIELDL